LGSFRERPLLGLTLGDPAGIGPEICRAAAEDRQVLGEMRLVLLGPGSLRPSSMPLLKPALEPALEPADLAEIERAAWLDTGGGDAFELGRPQAAAGAAALLALRKGAELAQARCIAALVTAPVSKEALHLAGEKVEGQTELLGRWAGVERFQMIAVAGALRVMVLTRHLPLRQALDQITPERVLDHLRLFERTLRGWGFERPRLALAGLNPHAGEAGILGREEELLLEPALRIARAEGLTVEGPVSPDAVFLQAAQGRFDGVLALYHDQAFIPVKLVAPQTGLTVIAGLPYLRVSPAHGTAFDIAGQGKASAKNLIVALRQAAAWAQGRNRAV
jgi:4-hydroxythreonine-4-phosphate dehydrogenase